MVVRAGLPRGIRAGLSRVHPDGPARASDPFHVLRPVSMPRTAHTRRPEQSSP
jgi:hypothetical protein